jgi:hypothetical protein
MKIYSALFTFIFSYTLLAGTLNGVSMPSTLKIENKELILNGMGTRKATWLKVKVYVGGLYTLNKELNPTKLLDMDYPKFIRMSFVRSVGAKKLKSGWVDAFEAAVPAPMRKKVQTQIDQFLATQGDIEKGQEILLTFLNKGVQVKFNGQDKGLMKGKDFSRSLLSVWFINAKDQGLRSGLLGL